MDNTRYDIVLEGYGNNRIATIKAVRALTGMGLKDARDAVENTPTVLLRSLSKTQARQAMGPLKEAGASVTVRRK